MQRRGNQVKYTELKNCCCEHGEKRKINSNIFNFNTPDVNMQRRVKETKIYRTERLQMSICRKEPSKVKFRK